MLKKVNRLAKAKDIQTTFARGRAFFTPFFTVKFLSSAPEAKFNVVVSNKVFKRAHDRNRMKRLIREYIRTNLSSFKKGAYMVLTKPKAASLPEERWVPEFVETLKRMR